MLIYILLVVVRWVSKRTEKNKIHLILIYFSHVHVTVTDIRKNAVVT
jgi:hypothetical protein